MAEKTRPVGVWLSPWRWNNRMLRNNGHLSLLAPMASALDAGKSLKA